MQRKSGYSFEADCATLRAQVSKGKPQPTRPTELPLGEIRKWVKVFQHRSFLGSASESHIRDLVVAIKRSKNRHLDPILVWWDGRAWACVDGHHRHAAYEMAGVDRTFPVPVEVFEGTLSQAMGAAGQANTKNKLPMSSAEKSNTAWRYVVLTDMSKADTAAASGVSESTVADMRKVCNQLEADIASAGIDFDAPVPHQGFRDLSWMEAKRLAEGREAPDFDWQEANEKQAMKMALSLRKALGKIGWKKPEVLARALELYDSRLPEQLADYWSHLEEGEE